jgi:hypothetical protein
MNATSMEIRQLRKKMSFLLSGNETTERQFIEVLDYSYNNRAEE